MRQVDRDNRPDAHPTLATQVVYPTSYVISLVNVFRQLPRLQAENSVYVKCRGKKNPHNSQSDVASTVQVEGKTALDSYDQAITDLSFIPCGTEQAEKENVREYFGFWIPLFGNRKVYFGEASVNSMVDMSVDDGERVVAITDCTAEVGDIVVENNESY